MFQTFCENSRKIYLASCLYDCIEDNDTRAVVKLLENNNADPNIIIPGKGISPFHLAIGNGVETTAEEFTRLFLQHGGNPNIRSDEKLTPVHIAAAWGRLEILNILLKCGGDPTLEDDQGKTPEEYAKEEGFWDIVAVLKEAQNELYQETHQHDKLSYDLTLDKVIINTGALMAEYVVCGNEKPKLSYNISNALLPYPQTCTTSYVQSWCMTHANMVPEMNCDLLHSNAVPKNIGVTDIKLNDEFVSIRKKTVYNKDDINDNLNNQSIVNNISNKFEYSPKKMLPYLEDETDADNSVQYISSEDSYVKGSITRESGILTLSNVSSNINESFKDDLNQCIIINSSTDNANTCSSASEYTTCESVNSLEKNVIDLMMTLDLSKTSKEKDDEVLNITSDRSIIVENTNVTTDHVTNIPAQLSVNAEVENDSFVSIAEEYKYVDEQVGIVLIEKRLIVNAKLEDNKSLASADTQPSSKVSTLPSIIDYDTDTLRKELTLRGEPPGPITKTTKRVYLRRLKKLKKTTTLETNNDEKCCNKVYSVELEKTLRNSSWTSDLTLYKNLENTVVKQFSNPEPTKRWREGVTKASFTYLLLDPRITNNLPARSDKVEEQEMWKTFLSAIFYVGKGKRSRPYSHLYEAVTYWNKGLATSGSKKINYILDIWRDQYGVVCLHIFQNVIPVEAYTREAAMINALKLQNLCNSKSGDYYGISATWPERQKRLFGVYLLYRAMLIFLNEGERQLRPDDIGK